MKVFQHTWDGDCFILHIQLTQDTDRERPARIVREFTGGKTVEESEAVSEQSRSHRFIVSRSHPDETGVRIEYPDDLVLEAYAIADRAFYPTTPFYQE